MEETKKNEHSENAEQKGIDLQHIVEKLWKQKMLYAKVLPVVFVVSCLYIICIPRTYSSDIKLAPEMDNSMGGGTLGDIASSLGFNLSDMQTSDAITPLLYPDLGDTYYVGIHLDKAIANPGSDNDIVLREGDRIIVPEYTNTVKISGDVMFPNTVSYQAGKSVKYYINQAGGWGNRAKKSHTYIIYMNGTVTRVGYGTKIEPGCEIVVPSKPKGNRMTLPEIMSIGTSTASLATMIASIANLIK